MQSNYPKWFLPLLGFFALYCCLFIIRTSCFVNETLYFVLADDQMISMAYARHWVQGNGLVWFRGASPVEGFSNPGWVLLMAAIHWLPLPLSKTSLCVQIAGAVFLLLNLSVTFKLARRLSESAAVPAIACVLTASYYSLNCWSLQGFEVSLLTLSVTYAVCTTLSHPDSLGRMFWISLLLGAMTFFRIDMAVTCFAYASWHVLFRRERRPASLAILILPPALCLLIQFFGRHAYYGDWLPNTYYLKMTGYPLLLRVGRGVIALLFYGIHSGLLLAAVPAAFVKWKNHKGAGLLFWMIGFQIFQNCWVGGDAWESLGLLSRFLVIVAPLYFIIVSIGLFNLWTLVAESLQTSRSVHTARWAALLCLLFLIVQFNSVDRKALIAEWLLVRPPLQWEQNRNRIETALELERLTRPGARIAVSWAGIIPYFLDRDYIDMLGKNDREIARLPMRRFDPDAPIFYWQNFLSSQWTFFFPGHMKWDYALSIARDKPDVIADLWEEQEKARALMAADYLPLKMPDESTIFISKSSPYINRDELMK